jgi:hypothetical protein
LYEFPTFVYLDVQKTGSNFVLDFLRLHMRDDAIRLERHTPVEARDPYKFYFITCRDPLDQYLSLYSFGCEGRGRFRKRLGEEMYDGTAAGFSQWLHFVVDEENTGATREMKKYKKSGIARFAGYQTFRFLNLSFASPHDVFAECRSKADLTQAFRTHTIWNECLRNEDLAPALADLTRRVLAPHLRDVDAALAYLDANEKLNTSERVDKAEGFIVSDADKRMIEDREWFFFEELGYPRYMALGNAA